MTTEVVSGALGEIRAASTAGGGTALTTTAGYIYLPLYTRHIALLPRNFATAVVAKFLTNPWLTILKTTDNLATVPTDYSENAQDGDTATDLTLSDLDTLANGDFLLVGSHLPFRGVYVDVDGTNGNAAVWTVTYWNGSTWVTTSATDNTILVAGKTLGQDGTITWTVPTAWKAARLSDIYPAWPAKTEYADLQMFWTRWALSGALDSSVTINNIAAMNRSTAYAELASGQVFEETIKHGLGGIGCIEALTDAGTANLVVNAASVRDGRFK